MAPVAAQTPNTPTTINAANLDIAGVRLGMTQDQTIAALKAFDPGLVITGLSAVEAAKNQVFSGDDSVWHSTHAIVAVTPDLDAYVTAAIESQRRHRLCSDKSVSDMQEYHNAKTKQEREEISARYGNCNTAATQYFADRRSTLEAPRAVAVWFSFAPGHETVIAVSSSSAFVKSPPLKEETKTAIFAKYGPAISESYGVMYWWKFDAKGRPKSKAEAARGGFDTPAKIVGTAVNRCNPFFADANQSALEATCPHVMMPSRIVDGGGVILIASFQKDNNNPLLLREVSLSLFDSSAAYAYIQQSRSQSENLTLQQRQEDAAKIKGATPKF
jgi:hypothetical protein